MNTRTDNAPELRDYRPPKTRDRYRPSKSRQSRISALDAFAAGFWGGVGFWFACLAINVAAFLMFVMVITALGGMGAILKAVQ